MPITRVAQIDREDVLADANAQNRPDLVDAQRRRVHGRVGRGLVAAFAAHVQRVGSCSAITAGSRDGKLLGTTTQIVHLLHERVRCLVNCKVR